MRLTGSSPVLRGTVRDSAALAVGSAGSGLLAYAFFAIASRTLGPAAAAPVSVLWSYWALAAAALTFPVQHWVIRSLRATGSDARVRSALPRVWLLALVAALLVGALSVMARRLLFDRDDLTFPLLMVIVTLGSCWSGVVRGLLSGRRRFVATALAILGENVIRFLGAALLARGSHSAGAFGVVLASGPLVALAWPRIGLPRRRSSHAMPPERLGLIGEIAGGSLVGQLVLTQGPVVLALLGGTAPSVTALFAALALFRAPYLLALGLVSQLTGFLTGLVQRQQGAVLGRVRLLLILGTGAAVAAGAAAGGTVGAKVVQVLFGEGLRIEPALMALLGASSGIALGNLAYGVLLTAYGAARPFLIAWCVGLAIAVVLLALPAEPLFKTAAAFAAAEAAAFLLVMRAEWRRGSHRAPDAAPGSLRLG